MSENNAKNQPEIFQKNSSKEKRKFNLSKGESVVLKPGYQVCNGCGGHKKTPSGFICPVCNGKGSVLDASTH